MGAVGDALGTLSATSELRAQGQARLSASKHKYAAAGSATPRRRPFHRSGHGLTRVGNRARLDVCRQCGVGPYGRSPCDGRQLSFTTWDGIRMDEQATLTNGDDLQPEDGQSSAAPPLVSLSHLQPVPITSVWPTEAHHFTPWLLNSGEQLSELLGIDVELESREYKVGKFSLDLMGREVATGNPVIVENQFGQTDHGHLGQVLTYAGGTKPSTIVWIAEQFREEHRAALDWLNEHTDPAIRFFGVKIGVVTIAGAPPGLIAPSFDLVVKPNDWEKQARAAATSATSAPSPTNELYRQFWSEFEPVAKERHWTNATPPAQNWWSMPSGTSGVTWNVSFAMFGCRSELYFGDPDPAVNTARWEQLKDEEAQLVLLYGEDELIFDGLPNNKGCRIETRLLGPKVTGKEQWPAVINWMIDTQTRLRSAIAAVGGIPSSNPGQSGTFS